MLLGDDVELKVSYIRLIPGLGDYEKILEEMVSKIYYRDQTREFNRIVLF